MGHLGIVERGAIEHYVGMTAGGRPHLTLRTEEVVIFETAREAQHVAESLATRQQPVSTREVNRPATVRLTLLLSPADASAPALDRFAAVLKQHGVQWSTTSVPGGDPPSYTAWLVVPKAAGVWEGSGVTPEEALHNALDPLFRHARQAGYEGLGGQEAKALQTALGDLSPR